MPFSVDEFLDVFQVYNQAIWPAQIIAYALGLALVILVFVRSSGSSRIISAGLALFWAWTGIAYHMASFSSINKLAYAFGLAFVLQAVFFVVYGVFKNELHFRAKPDVYSAVGGVLVAYSLIYPVVGQLVGHAYPRVPMFGVTPCPMTIFTFGLLLWTKESFPRTLLLIPFVWSLIGSVAAVSMGMVEDVGLLVAGIGSSLLIMHRERSLTVSRLKAAQYRVSD
jgi:hypothetical protein